MTTKNLYPDSNFKIPEKFDSILSYKKMVNIYGEEKSSNVLKAMKSINKLVVYDNEDDCFMFIEGGYTPQVLGGSLKVIEGVIFKAFPEYLRMVIKTFALDEYLIIPDYVYETETETKE